MARPSGTARSGGGFWALIGAHVLVWLAVIAWAPPEALHADISRFAQLASMPGLPYRDFASEFAPLQTLMIEMLFRGDLGTVAVRVAVLSLACDLGIALVLRRWWGAGSACRFLVFALPMQVFMPFRIDYVPTVLAVGAAATLRERDAGTGGVLLGAGVAFKLWPVALAPMLLHRRRSAIVWFAIVVLIASATWGLVGGIGGPRDVGTFRGATGWQVESTVGALTWVFTSEEPRVERGAVRVGTMATWHLVALAAIAITIFAMLWREAWRSGRDPAGFSSVAAIATLLVLSPVASPQYLAWMLPWCAIATAARRSRTIELLTVTVAVLASSSFLIYWDIAGGAAELRILAVARASLLLALAMVAVWATLGHPRGEKGSSTIRGEAARLISSG